MKTYIKLDDNTIIERTSETKEILDDKPLKIDEVKAKVAYYQNILLEAEKLGIDIR